MLAAKVAQPLQRGVARFAQRQVRALHMPPPSRLAARGNLTNHFQFLLKWAINRLASTSTSFAARGSSVAQTASRLAPRTSFQQSFTFPTRLALARPFGAPHVLRPPTVPRTMTQVGLGTARTFATSQPIFANLVQNVPVTARALQKAGSDIHLPHGQTLKHKRARRTRKQASAQREMLKPSWERGRPAADNEEAAFSQFFAPAPVAAAGVATYLDIPLAPTPSGRVPLPERPTPMLLRDFGAAHGTHSIKVASLFRRLDAADVWTRGADMHALGDAAGLCTVLRVRFAGWTAEDVRGVIGEGGRGWCALSEMREDELHATPPSAALSPIVSPLSTPPASPRRSAMSLDGIDDSSFIMPTLDFSSSFLAAGTNAWASDGDNDAAGYVADFSRTPSDGSDAEDGTWDIRSLASETRSLASETSGIAFSSAHWQRVSAFTGDF